MIVRLSGVDVIGLHSALTEIAEGLAAERIPAGLRVQLEHVGSVLELTGAIFLREPLEEAEFELDLTEEEAAAAASAIDLARERIDPREFERRTRVTLSEAEATSCRLKAAT
jgi:hypothetical protein